MTGTGRKYSALSHSFMSLSKSLKARRRKLFRSQQMAQCDVPSPASDGNDSRRMLWKALQALWLAHWQVSHASPVGDPILTGIGYQNKGPIAIPRTRQCGHVENPVPGQAGAAQHRVASPMPQQHSPGYKQGVQGVPAGQHMPFSHSTTWPHRLMATAVGRCPCNAD